MAGKSDRLTDLDNAMQRFGEAWAAGNIATLESLLSPTYTHSDALGGFHDRTSWLDYARLRTGRTTRIGFRDVQTRVVGDVAVVTGINDLSGQGALSVADQNNSSIRFTQVWIWDQDRWLREAFQATLLKGTA
jgi:ketosteroid isomerase-like protein